MRRGGFAVDLMCRRVCSRRCYKGFVKGKIGDYAETWGGGMPLIRLSSSLKLEYVNSFASPSPVLVWMAWCSHTLSLFSCLFVLLSDTAARYS